MDGDTRAHTFMWNHPPYKLDTGGDESPHTWKAIVFLNLSRIRSFLDTDRSTIYSAAAVLRTTRRLDGHGGVDYVKLAFQLACLMTLRRPSPSSRANFTSLTSSMPSSRS